MQPISCKMNIHVAMNIHESLVAAEEPWFADVVDLFALSNGILCDYDANNVWPGNLVHCFQQDFLLHTTQATVRHFIF